MSEMVELVAKAKWEHRRTVARDAGIELDSWEGELEGLREEVRAEVRAGFVAMREPTDAMATAVGSDWGAALEDNWRKMIDAAA